MSSFSATHLEKKIKALTMSQQSIQTLSLWCIHHRKHARLVVQSWCKELLRVKTKRKLALMYLANDILQNSRRKGSEYSKEFANILPNALTDCAKLSDSNLNDTLKRILNIWTERNVYDETFISRLLKCLDNTGFGEEVEAIEEVEEISHTPPLDTMPINETEFVASEHKRPEVPPDADDLVRRLQELENSATQDAVIRERIANLPTEVTDPTSIDKVEDLEAAKKLKEKMDSACNLLAEYNARLEQEQIDRKIAQKMLKDYTACQKYSSAMTGERLEEYLVKLEKVTAVKKELQSHLENLPDLSKLPNPIPLPSPGDLFASSGKIF